MSCWKRAGTKHRLRRVSVLARREAGPLGANAVVRFLLDNPICVGIVGLWAIQSTNGGRQYVESYRRMERLRGFSSPSCIPKRRIYTLELPCPNVGDATRDNLAARVIEYYTPVYRPANPMTND